MQSFYLPHRWLSSKQLLALHRFSLRPFPLFDTGIPSPSNRSYYYNVLNSNQANKALNVAHIAAGGWNKIEKKYKTNVHSLIQWKADQKSYAIYKLVHALGQDRLEADRQRQVSSLALKLTADATAEDQINPSYQLRLVPHVMASFGMFCPPHESLDELTMDRLAIIDGLEDFLFRIGRWSEAYKMRVFHLRKTEKMLGKEHASTLTSMNNLALVLSRQGKYDGAEEMHRQALALRERVLGKEHPDTLTSVYCLVYLLHHKKRYKDAEVFYHRAYAGYRKILGEKH